ncbi:MAG: (2Fe-2S)-binding protein [Alphaproteobacteria bacterium]|nr:(2Fe-2S)-binding protein [Alphaproteobacteria bacterium]
MTRRRIDQGIDRGAAFRFDFDGQPVTAYPGETVAAALLAAGIARFRSTARGAMPRGLYCGMGMCWECLVAIDGRPSNRACMTEAKPGMRVETQQGLGGPVRS